MESLETLGRREQRGCQRHYQEWQDCWSGFKSIRSPARAGPVKVVLLLRLVHSARSKSFGFCYDRRSE